MPVGWQWMYHLNPVPKALIPLCIQQFYCSDSDPSCPMLDTAQYGRVTKWHFIQQYMATGKGWEWSEQEQAQRYQTESRALLAAPGGRCLFVSSLTALRCRWLALVFPPPAALGITSAGSWCPSCSFVFWSRSSFRKSATSSDKSTRGEDNNSRIDIDQSIEPRSVTQLWLAPAHLTQRVPHLERRDMRSPVRLVLQLLALDNQHPCILFSTL